MYQQREPEASTFAIVGLWDPEVPLDDDRSIHLEPAAEDRYAVIDEIVENVVRLAVAPWPEVDAGGRLRFRVDEESQDFAYERDRLQSSVDARRAARGQLPRPLRVGDAFFIRDFGDGEPEAWQLVDITRPGRDAAKHASFRAIAQMPELEHGDTAGRDLSWRRPPEEQERPAGTPPTPSSIVNPAV